MRYRLEKKILTNHIELQDRMIRQIAEDSAIEYNAWSHRYGILSARYSEIDAEEYYEAEGRRTQARVMLEDIVRTIGVKLKYEDEQETTKCEGDVVPVYWSRARIEEV